jgi:hypothetical protein
LEKSMNRIVQRPTRLLPATPPRPHKLGRSDKQARQHGDRPARANDVEALHYRPIIPRGGFSRPVAPFSVSQQHPIFAQKSLHMQRAVDSLVGAR